MSELPIFPLDVVVFPGMTVPLSVREERYKRLVKLVLAQEREPKRFIVVVSGDEAVIRDTPLKLARFGTLVNVLTVEETSEGFELLVHGQERCEVAVSRSEDVGEAAGESRPLYFAEEAPAPVERSDPNDEAIAAWDAIDTFRDYAKTLFKLDSSADIDVHLPQDPFYQASFVCANLRVPAASKQPLLEAPSLKERFDLARDLMLRRLDRKPRSRRGDA